LHHFSFKFLEQKLFFKNILQLNSVVFVLQTFAIKLNAVDRFSQLITHYAANNFFLNILWNDYNRNRVDVLERK